MWSGGGSSGRCRSDCHRRHICQSTIVVQCFWRTQPRVSAFDWRRCRQRVEIFLRLISLCRGIYFDISRPMFSHIELRSTMCIGLFWWRWRHRRRRYGGHRCRDSHWIWHFFQHSLTMNSVLPLGINTKCFFFFVVAVVLFVCIYARFDCLMHTWISSLDKACDLNALLGFNLSPPLNTLVSHLSTGGDSPHWTFYKILSRSNCFN